MRRLCRANSGGRAAGGGDGVRLSGGELCRPIALEELSGLTGLSKYHLLRCFARQKGITPFQYLQNIRVDRAKTLLEQGCFPL